MGQEMADPKGEGLKLGFDGSLRLEFHGAKVISDAGLLAYRDLDEALVLFDSVPSVFHDSRTGRNIQHDLTALLRQSVYSRLAGYEDVNDAHRLSVDPTMRRITGKKIDNKNAASANTMGRFETQMLSVEDNLQALSEVNGRWVERALQKTTHRRIILDMDSSASPVHGQQEASAYNGHFGCTCYHPLFCFNQFGDCEGSMLRQGSEIYCAGPRDEAFIKPNAALENGVPKDGLKQHGSCQLCHVEARPGEVCLGEIRLKKKDALRLPKRVK